MEIRAHVLMQVDPGRSEEAARYVAELPDVVHACITTGAYDVIATASAGSEEALGRVIRLARRAPGLCALRLCRPT